MDYRFNYLKRAKRAARALRWCPFIRMVGLNGSIVREQDTPKSDIDFLIIAKSGRLYTARCFATILVGLTGYRRHGHKVAGRICLNCYLSDKNPDVLPKDPRSYYKVANAYRFLIALVDENQTAQSFFKINNWMKKYNISGENYQADLKQNYFNNFPIKSRKTWEGILSGKFGDYLEEKLMKYQVKRIMSGYKKGDETVATKEEIRLHPKKLAVAKN